MAPGSSTPGVVVWTPMDIAGATLLSIVTFLSALAVPIFIYQLCLLRGRRRAADRRPRAVSNTPVVPAHEESQTVLAALPHLQNQSSFRRVLNSVLFWEKAEVYPSTVVNDLPDQVQGVGGSAKTVHHPVSSSSNFVQLFDSGGSSIHKDTVRYKLSPPSPSTPITEPCFPSRRATKVHPPYSPNSSPASHGHRPHGPLVAAHTILPPFPKAEFPPIERSRSRSGRGFPRNSAVPAVGLGLGLGDDIHIFPSVFANFTPAGEEEFSTTLGPTPDAESFVSDMEVTVLKTVTSLSSFGSDELSAADSDADRERRNVRLVSSQRAVDVSSASFLGPGSSCRMTLCTETGASAALERLAPPKRIYRPQACRSLRSGVTRRAR